MNDKEIYTKILHHYKMIWISDHCFHSRSPYLSADLRLMASSFNTTVNQLEDELMALILDGQIQARIDSHNKVSKINIFTNLFSLKTNTPFNISNPTNDKRTFCRCCTLKT